MSLFWNQPRETSALFGTYTADNTFATEVLTLKQDGTYTQRVLLKRTGQVTVARGHWTYDTRTGYVTFDHHMMLVTNGFQRFNPDYAKTGTEGLVSLPADRFFGRIRIGAADDAAPYEKH